MATTKKQFVLSHVARSVSSLTDRLQYSPVEEHFDISWKSGYLRFEKYFKLGLFCDKPKVNGQSWSVTTNCILKATSINGKHVNMNRNLDFNTSECNGFGMILDDWDTILTDYVVVDTLILEIHVTIETMEGIERPAKIRNFDVSAKQYSDVALKVGEEEFYVSKLYLAAQCTYFDSLLLGNFMEGKTSEVTLKDINPEDFQNFLELCYMEQTLTDSNIENVLNLVDMYDAKNGARVCEHFLMSESKHSLRNKLRLAAQYNLKKLQKQVLDQLKCSADIRAVMESDLTQWDASLATSLLKMAMNFK